MQWYSVTFAFYILLNKKSDDINDQIAGVGDSALMTEQILAKIRNDYETTISIQSSNSLSYNDVTNEGLSCTRTDMTVNIPLNQCETPLALSKIFTK